jgi:hypothetical protein
MKRDLIPSTSSRIQLGICVSFCKLFWSEILSSASAKFGISSLSAIILVFRLPFSFCNLVFVFSFCKMVLCFGVIV